MVSVMLTEKVSACSPKILSTVSPVLQIYWIGPDPPDTVILAVPPVLQEITPGLIIE